VLENRVLRRMFILERKVKKLLNKELHKMYFPTDRRFN
jgi:hypothetical protein